MNKNILIAVVIVIAGLAAYLYWSNNQLQPEPASVQAPTPPPPPEIPQVRQEIVAPPEPASLPELADSDKFVLDAIAGLIGNKSLMKLFHTDRIIHNIVATIDNLTGRRAPMSVMPVEQVAGKFVTAGEGDELVIGQKNAARYTPYVKIASAINMQQLVELYVRLYPLFQQAYEELGYPKKYFNDRLVVVLDDLLAAPDVKEPVKLVQPNVYFQYADPDLEMRSIGQRILMRMGSRNEATVKAKLLAFEQELKLHVREKKLEQAR